MTVGFVLLHYNNISVTVESVKHLKELNKADNEIIIIIVDNNSPDGSGELLENMYNDDVEVKVILNTVNEGFAKGNNIGYRVAKTQYNAEWIIIMNTDVYIYDKNFIKSVLNITDEVHVIAPDIFLPNGKHQNPLRIGVATRSDILKIYKYNKRMCYIYKIPILNAVISYILDLKSKLKGKDVVPYSDLKNITPHGACVIFTRNWILNEDIAFPPETFLFMEEDNLMFYIELHGYITVFKPNLIVHHMAHSSIRASHSDRVRKRIFLAENMKKSAYILLEKMDVCKKYSEVNKHER